MASLAVNMGTLSIAFPKATTGVRIPTKPAMHSNLMPATYSDFIPAGIPI